MRLFSLLLSLSLSCSMAPQPPKDTPPEELGPAPTFTNEEQAARAVAERFVSALREKDSTKLASTCTPSLALQDFLPPPPQSGPKTPPSEEEIARAATKSEAPHLRRLAESKLASITLPRGKETLVLLEDSQQNILTLVVSGEQVVRIGAEPENPETWRNDRCARLSAPVLISKKLPEDATRCREQLSSWKQSISPENPSQPSWLLAQPLLTALEEKSVQEGLSRFAQGQDAAAYAYGQEQGKRALSYVWSGLVSYCNCLPRRE